jgi:hypothetical protein
MEEAGRPMRLNLDESLFKKDKSMKTTRMAVMLLIGAVVIFSAATLSASDPVGTYAIVEKVVFEPNETSPQRVQIWGVFSQADTTRGGDFYSKPQRGYLYYTVVPGKEAIARKEWADFKSVAGTGQGIAFGARYSMLGKVRKETDAPASPDPYSVNGNGATKVNPSTGYQPNMEDVVAQLKAALKDP